jgi:aspartate kinase
MQILKFGGTSVGSVENMIAVRHIIDTPQSKIVVLSAMSGTTNMLTQIADCARIRDFEQFLELSNALQSQYDEVIDQLFTSKPIKAAVIGYVDEVFTEMERLVMENVFSRFISDALVAQGELLSTFIFSNFLKQEGLQAVLLPALDFMRIDSNQEPDKYYIQENVQRLIDQDRTGIIYITQGFICRDFEGRVSNLQRGGSDYTATILGAAIGASEVQIWTDIDGFHNNDPRFVEQTQALPVLSYDEAAELAYFGAKILHPQTVQPLRAQKIPLRLKNTMHPNALGTLVTYKPEGQGVKAIAAKDGIIAIKIKSARMLQSHGFLRKVFEIFERYETAIDMITTSEIAISLTIDDATHLLMIQKELTVFSQVTIDKEQSIICLVGNEVNRDTQTPQLFQLLRDVQVRMISYGGSDHNISLLVATEDKQRALQLLQRYMFEEEGSLQ